MTKTSCAQAKGFFLPFQDNMQSNKMVTVWQSQPAFPQGGQLDFHHSHGICVLNVLTIALGFRVKLPYTRPLTDSFQPRFSSVLVSL